ncbi:hypothetical protein BDR04DRAFT_1158754 [Suillus decipiens]|nr:hypothetical protein BDR04DRAFT_1158754 [Suillus decipiens]
MPCHSLCNELLDELDEVYLALKKARLQWVIRSYNLSDSDSDDFLDMIITPPTPPMRYFSDTSDLDSSSDESDNFTTHYDRLNNAIISLQDEVIMAHVLHCPNTPPMRAPQIQLLHDGAMNLPFNLSACRLQASTKNNNECQVFTTPPIV